VGLATTPLVRPGDPIANIVFVREKKIREILEKEADEKESQTSHDEEVAEQDIDDEEGSTLDETEFVT
jgi:Ulp1 family protease